jgi:hypothetical protein
MSARQKLLLRRLIADRFAPPMSARLPLVGLTSGRLRGHNRRSETAAGIVLNHAFAITSDYGRDQRKNPDANSCFWCDLTFFRMNTCAKRVGGGGEVSGAVSPCRTPGGVQLHPRRDCATVRLKVR